MSDTPKVVVSCAPNKTYPKLPAAIVRSTAGRGGTELKEGETHDFSFPDARTKISVEALSQHSRVTVQNQTTVQLVVSIKRGRDETDDVLKANHSTVIPHGARAKIG